MLQIANARAPTFYTVNCAMNKPIYRNRKMSIYSTSIFFGKWKALIRCICAPSNSFMAERKSSYSEICSKYTEQMSRLVPWQILTHSIVVRALSAWERARQYVGQHTLYMFERTARQAYEYIFEITMSFGSSEIDQVLSWVPRHVLGLLVCILRVA